MRFLDRFRITCYLGLLYLWSPTKGRRRTWKTTRSSKELGMRAKVEQEISFPIKARALRRLVLLFATGQSHLLMWLEMQLTPHS